MDAYTIEPFDIFGRIATIEFINDIADADIRADFQCPCYVDVLITSSTPVVVFHVSTMHIHDTTSSMDDEVGISGDYTVVKGHKE